MQALKLKDSLTNKLVEVPGNLAHEVKLYLCGPTVYDHTHIGNMRPSVVFDLIVRVLNEINLTVNYIQNITDIDDKIIERSAKEVCSEEALSLKYTASYLANFKALNLLMPTFQPVTANITSIVSFVEQMIENDNAYLQGTNVMFDIGKQSKEYGKLSKQLITKLSRKNARKLNLVDKRNEKDFVLWKGTTEGKRWKLNNPALEGRPGWHTECATLINKFFGGETIDLHGGGKDLLFPHHENERIQYWAVNERELSKTWIHFGHVNYQGIKMSKSLGNQLSTKHFIEMHGAQTLRFLLLNSNYNEDICISEALIQQAKSQVRKIENVLKKLSFFLVTKERSAASYSTRNAPVLELLLNNLESVKVFFALEECVTFLNKNLEDESKDNSKQLDDKIAELVFILKVTGFNFPIVGYSHELFELVSRWRSALLSKDFQEADRLRSLLQGHNLL